MFQQEELYQGQYALNQASLKFTRRADISSELRLHIASIVLCFNDYGTVTNLAKKHKVSRTFIYYLRNQLILSGWVIFGMLDIKADANKVDKKLEVIKEILSLRLEGKSPILGISLLLKRKKMCNTSIGYISEVLNEIGTQLSSTITIEGGVTYALVFASDEVFSSGSPVLITVDPVSSVILKMELAENRKSDSWEAHWQSLLDGGIIPICLTSDEGSGMKAAREIVFPNLAHQTDTFHALAYRFGEVLRILEAQTYAAISAEYEQQELLERAKGQEVRAKRYLNYESAKAKSRDYIRLYEDFCFWYECAIEQFQTFDVNGELFTASQARENLELTLQEIGKLNWFSKSKNEKISEKIATIKNLLPKLFHFLDHAQKVVNNLMKEACCEKEIAAIKMLCAAYQFRKNGIKAKCYKSKKYFVMKEEEQLTYTQILLENTPSIYGEFYSKVYTQLDTIVQSSAMVETINSIVRSYFNCSKNHITQAQLNLITFYHNHRRYVQGKRKGYTPMELLTGEIQEEDWLDLMLKKVNKIAA